jgi:hypothetical protein
MDRHDIETVAAMLLTSIGVGLNLVFLQAVTAAGDTTGRWVLIPIFAGLAVGLSGFVEHVRRRGRDMVIVDRICMGAAVYLALSALTALAFQPRFD